MARMAIVFKRREPHQRARLGDGWSIFPEFDVNVPMPKDTAIPPRILIIPATPPAEKRPDEFAYE
jgi:hypothetical protein